jgi:hypothetical protein
MNASGPGPLPLLFGKLDPFRKYEVLFSSALPNGKQLSLRPLWITADLFIVGKWPLPGGQPHRRLLKHYKDILESDQGQSLIVLLQDKPLFQMDIFLLRRQDERVPVTVLPGDGFMAFITDPVVLTQKSLLTATLRLCLGYFFQYDGAERIFVCLPRGLEALFPIMAAVGFVPVRN